MDNQTTKIRGSGQRYTGLTDLEWAKIAVAKQQYNVACETFDKLQSKFSGAPKSSVDLAFSEYMLQVEEILASSGSGRRIEDDETETSVLVGNLLSIAKSLKDGTEYLRDPYRFHVHMNANKIQALAGVEVTA